ncbi:hypothetical protein NEIELOOT_01110 [Neisseria elongata subsp. glycolytica ATCC 29315]|uniref:Uncharacterized protein n=1 Tax=Neisseria elongata subsp. glycolytica ATCC 29315 TaxID=546263 RepID=D4DPX3_NEIEG|nr:hypothetical protein NEIELOOT_01110 [Neisseria elongata subsp. glycolytica ATCC 29315]
MVALAFGFGKDTLPACGISRQHCKGRNGTDAAQFGRLKFGVHMIPFVSGYTG